MTKYHTSFNAQTLFKHIQENILCTYQCINIKNCHATLRQPSTVNKFSDENHQDHMYAVKLIFRVLSYTLNFWFYKFWLISELFLEQNLYSALCPFYVY